MLICRTYVLTNEEYSVTFPPVVEGKINLADVHDFGIQEYYCTAYPTFPSNRISIVLSWMDHPSEETSDPSLLIDLDLVIKYGNSVRKGNSEFFGEVCKVNTIILIFLPFLHEFQF